MSSQAIIGLSTGGLAVLAVLFSGLKGFGAGFFRASAALIGTLLALLLSLRLWYFCAAAVPAMVPIPSDMMASLFLWILFALGWIALTAFLGKLRGISIPTYPPLLEKIGGFICGGLNGAALYLVILLGLYPCLPRLAGSFDTGKITHFLENGPLRIYQNLETWTTALPANDPARTPLPKLEATDAGTRPVWE